MSDDFNEFACPRCQEEPRRGIFLGAQIWHDECIVEDLVEKFKNGEMDREQVEEKLKKIKNDGVSNKVENGCGWNEPQKSLEEIQAEYEASVEAATDEAEANAPDESEGESEGDVEGGGDISSEDVAPVENEPPADKPGSDAPTPVKASPAPAKASVAKSKPTAGTPARPMQPTTMQPNVLQSPVAFPAHVARLAPRDPEIRFMTMSLMRACMKNIKDIEWAKLLFNIIKTFDWPKEEGKSSAIEFGLPLAAGDGEGAGKDDKKKQLATLFSSKGQR